MTICSATKCCSPVRFHLSNFLDGCLGLALAFWRSGGCLGMLLQFSSGTGLGLYWHWSTKVWLVSPHIWQIKMLAIHYWNPLLFLSFAMCPNFPFCVHRSSGKSKYVNSGLVSVIFV